jgi:hypothetical protein
MIRQAWKYRAPLGAAVIGGLLGIFIGAFLGSEFGAIASFALGGYEGPRWPLELGRVLGMAIGLAGGSFLGLLIVGRPTVTRWCIGTALSVGAVLFLAGFVGPILLTPNSPQGPLLGVFLTGPLGLVIGAMIGLYIGVTKEGREKTDRSPSQRSMLKKC